jgi:hypothetical protein
MIKNGLTLLALSTLAFTRVGIAQKAHTIPFASSGNCIELAVTNESSTPISAVKVEITNVPPWLRFSATELRFGAFNAGEELSATFSFSVDKSAPVGREHTLSFVITSATGEQWSKEITLSVSPPERFELYQNYPNPFNPSTAISYQLSAASKVSLKVFDVLGREVATLADDERAPGHHQQSWDASHVSSGMYIYQLTATDERGTRQVTRKAMVLLK